MKKQLGLFLLSLATLPMAAQQTTGTIGRYELSPAAGVVEELRSVRITFQDLGYWWLDTPDCSGVTLTSDAGEVYNVVKTQGDMENYCVMYFGQDSEEQIITAAGKYTLSIPEGVFKQDFSSDKYNAPIEAVYEIEALLPNTLDNYTLTPVSSQALSSLESITISYSDAKQTGVSLPEDLSQITLTADDVTYTCVGADILNGTDVTMRFGKKDTLIPLSFARPGEYKLMIPKKVFNATGTDEWNNYQIEATYTVDNPTFNSMAQVETIPAQGEYLTSFKTLKCTFPQADKGVDWPSDLSGIKLYINGELSEYMANHVSMSAPFDNVSFSFSATQYGDAINFTQEGEYKVTVPASLFKESGSQYCNDEFAVTFHIGEEPAPNPFDTYTTIPADGEKVGEIYEITLSFPELAESRIQWPYDISKLKLQRVGDDVSYKGNSTMLSQGYNVITGFTAQDEKYSNPLHFRTPGEYVVTVPAGTFVCDADPQITNNEITLHFTVDATYNFTYQLTPDPQNVVAQLPTITIEPTDALSSISLAADTDIQAYLTNGDVHILLSATDSEGSVVLTPQQTVDPGQWTLTVPAGMLAAVTTDGLSIVNARELTQIYTVKTPHQYSYSVAPADGETVSLFTKFTVSVEDSPWQVGIDATAGTPTIQGQGVSYDLLSAFSASDVMFAIKGGASLEDGEYTVSIPEGYIVTTDSDKLQAALPAITSKFSVHHSTKEDFAEGMLLYNEGWYGHDMASFTHIADNGVVTYNVFADENPDKSLGLTGTWASRFADKLYAVSKQDGVNLTGAQGGVLTMLDGASLDFIDNIVTTNESNQGHAFCAVNADKGYLSTSTGIYPVNLATMTLGERMAATKSFNLKYGEMLRYQGRIFAAVESWDPLVIDPVDDSFTTLETGSIITSFVTPDGSLYMAKNEEGREFVKVNPIDLSYEYITLDGGDYTGRMRVANVWSGAWQPAPLAVDLNDNVVYYATNSNATTVARADLDNKTFTPDFIKLPATDNAQLALYGQGISVDPHTGEIVLIAVEEGLGSHYTQTYLMRVDPSTGQILDDKTLKLSEYYWFPSMAVYGGFEAPQISVENVSLAQGAVTLNMLDITELPLGNKYQVEYTVTSSNPRVCSVRQTGLTNYQLIPGDEGMADITIKADYQGLVAEVSFIAGTSGADVILQEATPVDVYTTTGLLVLRRADATAIRNLPSGIYIAGGRKIMVR